MNTRLLPLMLTLSACASAGPEATDSEEIGVLEQSDLIQGRDGGTSARLWGRSWWIYGDTVLNVEDEDGSNWHHNSVSWTEDTDASDGITGFTEPLDGAGAPAHFIAPTAEEHDFNMAHHVNDCQAEPCGARWAVWPGAPVWDAQNERGLIPYGLIYAEPGDFNFEHRGQSVAIWSDPDAPPERTPELLWGEDERGWGVAAYADAEHLYLFACDKRVIEHQCRLARAPLAEVQARGAWEYRDRSGWSADPDDAVVLFEGAPIMSMSWSAHHDALLLIYSEPFSDEIVARTAPEPWGPWSRAAVIHRADGEEPYDVVHHSEFEEDGGRVQYLTWSRPTDEGWFGTEFPIARVTFE